MNKQVKTKNGLVTGRGIEWTDYDRGWLSAVIDSEGHISLNKEKRPSYKAGCTYIPVVGIANQNLAFIQRAQDLIGGGTYHLHKGNNVFNYVVPPKLVAKVLPELTFVIKENQKKLVLAAIEVMNRKAGRAIPRTDEEIQILEGIWLTLRAANMRNKEAA